MNAILVLRRGGAFLLLLSLCLSLAACGKRQAHVWQADRGARERFSFAQVGESEACAYVLNLASARIHRADCRYVKTVKAQHRLPVSDTERASKEGYRYCTVCFPEQSYTKNNEKKD